MGKGLSDCCIESESERKQGVGVLHREGMKREKEKMKWEIGYCIITGKGRMEGDLDEVR